MNNCSKIILTIGLAVSLQLGLCPTSDIALSATAPAITIQPSITTQISTPMRLATDLAGNVYVSDPHAGGILKYNSSGSLIQKVLTSNSGGGVAIAQDGTPNARLLVAQVTYVSVVNPATGLEVSRFTPLAGPFKFAHSIAVDTSNNIYVSDSRDNKVYKFNSSYVQQTPIVSILNGRPTGLAYDKANARLAVANSMAGNFQFYNPLTMTLLETVGTKNINDVDYVPPVYPASPEFTFPQGISFEYTYNTAIPPAITGLNRIYVAETFQSNIQVLDGVSPYNRIADVGGYGFVNGKLYVPSDVLVDQFSSTNNRMFVANGGGTLAVYGINSSLTYYALGLTTNGDGTINGSASCGENTVCSQQILSGSTVTLTATANALSSVFTGWSGACTGSATTCQFTMNGVNNVTATFALQVKAFSVNGSYYDNLQAAYNAAPTGSTIKIMAGTQQANVTGAFTADDPTKTVTLKGGYDSQFTEPPAAGNTVITGGRLNVKAGKVISNNVRVK